VPVVSAHFSSGLVLLLFFKIILYHNDFCQTNYLNICWNERKLRYINILNRGFQRLPSFQRLMWLRMFSYVFDPSRDVANVTDFCWFYPPNSVPVTYAGWQMAAAYGKTRTLWCMWIAGRKL